MTPTNGSGVLRTNPSLLVQLLLIRLKKKRGHDTRFPQTSYNTIGVAAFFPNLVVE